MSDPQQTKQILIVGGGTSGWLCAAYMANILGTESSGGPAITLMEASDIPTIGVGEATIPPIRSAIAATGLGENEFLKATGATFKMAIRFDGWRKSSASVGEHKFYHAFGQHGRVGLEPLAPYWLLDPEARDKSFVDYSMNNGPIIEAMRGPKRSTDKPFGGPLDYAYHFDAGLLAELLKKRATSLGVKHRVGNVADVETDGANITAITTASDERLEADLYVDCTGFHAALIEKALDEPFVSMADVLFCDRAIACPVGYPGDSRQIPPYTKSVARSRGWIWDVPLQHRRGTGIVYSSRHMSDDEARATLFDYHGDVDRHAEPRGLKFRVGYREKCWRGNCVAIGLSGGFVEPLESTGIYITDIAVRWLTDFCRSKAQFGQAAQAFNSRIVECYRDVIDFVKMHYVLSDRDDTAFWTENRDPASIPQSLQNKLKMWAHRIPSEYEFGQLPAVFGFSNYVQLLMAMGHYPPTEFLSATYGQHDKAADISRQLAEVARSGLDALPDHRELIETLVNKAA
jgi:tryptophan 7-halogenase